MEPERRQRALLRIAAVAIVALIALEIGGAALQAHRRDAVQAPPAPLAAGTPLDERIPHLRLIDEHGRATSLDAFRGRYLVLAPSLTLCHEVCPLTTGALLSLRDRLRDAGLAGRVVVAEASVDPWRDSPARIRAFKRRTGADIRFLTGTKAELRALWRTFGVEYHRVAQDDPPDEDWWTHRPETFDVEHTDGLFIIDPRGHWRVALTGMPVTAGRLPQRLASLLNDEGRRNLRDPDTPWTVDGVLDDLLSLTGHPAPAPRAPTAAETRSELRGSPAPLAALHRQAGQILDGGTQAFGARRSTLRGHPLVVNEWAAWCPPCRQELPLLAAAASRYGARVAFLGLDVQDSRDAARRLLGKHPLSYPSYADPDAALARGLARFAGVPTTVFIDASGRITYVHPGEYHDAATLAADIERHALGGDG
jgi:cytochrome oxidase Cu insertion factor (SCO1/SenC/PrrC family)/thiol-disulfide isomerase/thioredoxin